MKRSCRATQKAKIIGLYRRKNKTGINVGTEVAVRQVKMLLNALYQKGGRKSRKILKD